MMDANSVVSSIVGFITGIWDYILANPDAISFIVLAAIAIAAAISVVTSEEIMHSAFYLALVFVCVAVTYFFLEAEFIGIIQLIVYVGAITMLFAFSIMLTRRTIQKEDESDE